MVNAPTHQVARLGAIILAGGKGARLPGKCFRVKTEELGLMSPSRQFSDAVWSWSKVIFILLTLGVGTAQVYVSIYNWIRRSQKSD